ncbi:MAG TPA: VWA domain-containing protein [Terriglobia bacterium]|nr:VWA domain-containing protein [Terriglobia bacterium]
MLNPRFLSGALLAIVGTVVAQTPTSTIRVDVPLVTVDMTVSETNDGFERPVTNLTRNDFLIFEDGKPQEIRAFSAVASANSLLLLIDRSLSMQEHWPLMEPAIVRLLVTLQPQDRVSIGAFDERSKEVEVLLDWKDVRDGLPKEIRINPAVRGNPESMWNSSVVGMTAGSMGGEVTFRYDYKVPVKDFYRAVDWAAKRLTGVPGRKGAIVFTDGRQPGTPTRQLIWDDRRFSQLVDGKDDGDFMKVVRAVQKSEARFDFVAVNTDLNPRDGRFEGWVFFLGFNEGISVRSRLEQIASSSGGRVALPVRVEDTERLYENIVRSRNQSYTIGYSPTSSKEGVTHRIEVRTREPKFRVQQSRDSYTPR